MSISAPICSRVVSFTVVIRFSRSSLVSSHFVRSPYASYRVVNRSERLQSIRQKGTTPLRPGSRNPRIENVANIAVRVVHVCDGVVQIEWVATRVRDSVLRNRGHVGGWLDGSGDVHSVVVRVVDAGTTARLPWWREDLTTDIWMRIHHVKIDGLIEDVDTIEWT